MAKIIIRGQMVSINKIEERDYKDSARKDKLKVVYFTVADRDKHPTKDGTPETDGFYFCKAIGETATFIEKFCSKKDASGKLVSRKVYIEAVSKQYKDSKQQVVNMSLPALNLFNAIGVPCPENVKNTTIALEKTESISFNNYLFEVKEFKVDDYIPDEKPAAESTSVSIKVDMSNPYQPPIAPTASEPVPTNNEKAYSEPEMPAPFSSDEFSGDLAESPWS